MDYPKKWKCPNCSELVDNNKVCPNCKFRFGNHYPKLWSCPNCSNINSDSEFCKSCDYPNNLSFPKLWHCHECSNLIKDSTKCDVCGFEFNEKKPEPEPVIEKKIVKKEFMDKKTIYLMSIGIIILSLVLVFYSFDFSPKEVLSNNLTAGTMFSKDFILASNLDSVTFELESPTGETVVVEGQKKSSNIWRINNISLNESGTWNVKITGVVGLSSFESSDSLNIMNSCNNDSDCINSVCCSGACISVCSKNSDCDDYNSLTTDTCVNSNTCNAKCSNTALACNTIARDGYCPANCNKDNDVDCVSCASDEALCNNVCKKIECKSNIDCSDNNPSTIDKCVIMNNQCQNYCENNFYEGSCASGKIEYNGYCITPSCISAEDCYKEGWSYNCLNSGTINAYCSYFKCSSSEIICLTNGINKCTVPACKRNSDCLTGQVCENAWECNARCVASASAPAAPTSCSENQYLCSGSCKSYENLCSWPSTPIDSNLCICNESAEYLSFKSEPFELSGFSANSNSTVASLSALCSGCNYKTGNCFEGKKVKISYTIRYTGDSSVNVPVIGLSKTYDHVAQSSPPQIESRDDYFIGTIMCNNNLNMTLSSELSATLSNVRIFVQSDEMVEKVLVNNNNDYSSSVCPSFDNSEYIITFDIDSVVGNFSMKYGLDKSNKTIVFNETQSNVISRGIINCSLSNNNITFIPNSDVFQFFSVSNVKLYVKGCENDFDCANNEFDKCSISKCISNKCQASRINSEYCRLNKNETMIEFGIGSEYLNESICNNSLNNGKYYLINAEKRSDFTGELTLYYGADSLGTSVTITTPERIIISGKINCSKPEKRVIASQALDSFSMYIKDFEMPLAEQANISEVPITPTIVVPNCIWPTTLNVADNVCDMVSTDSENLVIYLTTMNTAYGKTSDSQSLDYLCSDPSYDGKEFYLNYHITYNGKVELNIGILDFSKTYTSLWNTAKTDEISGKIKCSNYKEIILKNNWLFPSSSSEFSDAILYIKKN
ncbi:MAG: hypothetical protein WC393_01840 [Candidatus Nanoarchaeia archaeon]|jgi:hypothetical protein